MRGQCDARPTVTFPAAGPHRPLTGTKLHCLVAEARACEQLAQGCYLKAPGRGSNPRPSGSQVQRPTTTTPPRRKRMVSVICVTDKSSWPTVLKFVKIHLCTSLLNILHFVFELWYRHSVTYTHEEASVGSADIAKLFSSVTYCIVY